MQIMSASPTTRAVKSLAARDRDDGRDQPIRRRASSHLLTPNSGRSNREFDFNVERAGVFRLQHAFPMLALMPQPVFVVSSSEAEASWLHLELLLKKSQK